jgi:WD40 repeat protein
VKFHSLVCGTLCLVLGLVASHCFAAPVPPEEQPKERATLEGHRFIVSWLAFSPDGKALASASWDGTVKLWDVGTGKNTATLEGHTGEGHIRYVKSVAFSPDGKRLASGGNDSTIRLWDVSTGKETTKITANDAVEFLCFSPDGKTLASDGVVNLGITVWDLETKKESFSLKVGAMRPGSVGYDSKGKLLVAAATPNTTDAALWDVDARKSTALRSSGSGCAFRQDGKVLVTRAGDGNAVKLWEVAGGKSTATFKFGDKDEVTCAALSPDGKWLACGTKDRGANKNGTIHLIDVAAGKEVAALNGHTGPLFCVTFSPDSKTLASASADKTIKLWKVPSNVKPAK